MSRRVRGFAEWNPNPRTLALLGQVQAVLDEYEAYLPLTCRQVFYRLVGAHGYDKTERAYDCLCEMLNRARRARCIDMDVIRDDGGNRVEPYCWQDAEHFIRAVRKQAETVRLDRTGEQPIKLVIMCEAAGMVPQLAAAIEDYGLPVFSSGGFESLTEKHAFAERLDPHAETEVLHIGDHDPSGVHLFTALTEDVQAFGDELGGSVSFTRLAVTPEQIADLRLPTAPPKATDRRRFEGRTCQAEAIPPDVLARIVREAVEERTDMDAYHEVLKREKEVRAEIVRRLKK